MAFWWIPLTWQRPTNFRLQVNQWAERRLVTQWRHGCRSEAKCVQRRCFQWGSIPLRSDIKGTELLPANILIPLERQLIALQRCRWLFLYNETLQQTSRPLLSKLVWKTNLGIWSAFWGSRGGVEPSLMARWKARIRLPIRHNWTFFASSCRWGATLRQNVSRLAAIRMRVGQFELRFQGEGVVPAEYFLVSTKLDTFSYLTVQTAPCYVQSFWHNTGVWQTDRRTDGRNCCRLYSACNASIAARCKNVCKRWQKRYLCDIRLKAVVPCENNFLKILKMF